MRKIEALTAVTLTSGRFKLTPEQYQRRRHVVNVLDKDALIVEPKPSGGQPGQISFKRGEVFESDLDIGKSSTHLCFVEAEVPAAPNEPASAAVKAGDSEPAATDGPETQSDPLASLDVDAPAVDKSSGGKRGRNK